MSEFEYIFVLLGPLPDEFSAQQEKLAELILELGGRRFLPKVWTLVDWLRARPKASSEILVRRKKRQAVLGLMALLLALFALGPAVTAPKELLAVLLAGAACLGAGIVSLWKRHRFLLAVLMILAGLFYGIASMGGGEEFRSLLILGILLIAVAVVALLPRRKKRNRAATEDVAALFKCRSSIPEGHPIRILFSPQGVQGIAYEKPGELLPYDAIAGILETEDLLVVVQDRQGFLLAKSELFNGVFSDFKAELSKRVLWLSEEGVS